MCTNYTPTKKADRVKTNFGVDLPNGYPDEAYPNFLGPMLMKRHQTERVACAGLLDSDLIPAWAKDDKIRCYIHGGKSTGPKPKHGQSSKAAKNKRRAIRELIKGLA